MSIYKSWFTTPMFAAAQAAAASDKEPLTFKRMIASSDVISTDDFPGLTNDILITIKTKQSTLMSGTSVEGSVATTTAVFTNTGVTEEYSMNTLLLVAEYKGKELLAAITTGNESYQMPAESDIEQVEYTIKAQIGISNSGIINLNMHPEAVATNENVLNVKQVFTLITDGHESRISDLEEKEKSNVKTVGNQQVDGEKTFLKTIVGSISGIAGSARKLLTARKINGTLFDGTSDINVNAANDSNLVHKSGNESVNGVKTFTSKQIGDFTPVDIPIGTDLYKLIDNNGSSNRFFVNNQVSAGLNNSPFPGQAFYLEVYPSNGVGGSTEYTMLRATRYNTGEMLIAENRRDAKGVITNLLPWTKTKPDPESTLTMATDSGSTYPVIKMHDGATDWQKFGLFNTDGSTFVGGGEGIRMYYLDLVKDGKGKGKLENYLKLGSEQGIIAGDTEVKVLTNMQAYQDGNYDAPIQFRFTSNGKFINDKGQEFVVDDGTLVRNNAKWSNIAVDTTLFEIVTQPKIRISGGTIQLAGYIRAKKDTGPVYTIGKLPSGLNIQNQTNTILTTRTGNSIQLMLSKSELVAYGPLPEKENIVLETVIPY